jgi:hypothetical protein
MDVWFTVEPLQRTLVGHFGALMHEFASGFAVGARPLGARLA